MSRRVSIRLTDMQFEKLGEIVESGFYLHISEVIRSAINDKIESCEV